MAVSNLKRKTVKGFFWSFLESIFTQGQGIIFGIILARLLSPDEFGLLGMITIFISISHVFIDSGLSQSLIRKQNCSINDYSTIFWINLLLGLISYGILWSVAPLISGYYNKPELILLTRVTSLAILFGSVTLIQQTILTKDIDFKTLTKSSSISTFISGIIAIMLALKGFGVWSLVWKMIIFQFVRSAILWNQNKWWPEMKVSRTLLKEHFAFGSNILALSLIATLFKNFSNLIIGKTYSERILGYYTNADQYSYIPSNTISTITAKVSYPALSEIQEDDQNLRLKIKKLITTVMYISFVIMFGLAAVARPLFVVFLGEKWLPAVVMFQALCIGYSISPLQVINQNIMKIKGRTDLFLRTEILKYSIFAPLLVLGTIYGITILIGGIVLIYWIGFFVNSIYSKKLIKYSFFEQLIDIMPLIAISFIPAIITWSIGLFLNIHNIILLAIQTLLYPSLVLLLSVFFRIPALYEIRQILADKLTIANFLKTFNGTTA